VVPSDDRLPAKTRPLTEYNGDKLLVAFDPEGDTTLPLEVAYSLARARVLMSRGEDDTVDSGAIRDVVERALAVVDDARKIKSQLTGSKKGIEAAYEMLDEMENRVRDYLRDIEALAAAGGDANDGAEEVGEEEPAPAPAPVAPPPPIDVIPGQESLV
jgi:hypothetical protein